MQTEKKTNLTTFFKIPKVVEDLITDYVYQLEHASKWKLVCYELHEIYWIRKRIRLNIEFSSLFFSGFYQAIVSNALNEI